MMNSKFLALKHRLEVCRIGRAMGKSQGISHVFEVSLSHPFVGSTKYQGNQNACAHSSTQTMLKYVSFNTQHWLLLCSIWGHVGWVSAWIN